MIFFSFLQRAQKLNPMVKITVDKESLASKGEEFFKNFHVVILTNTTEDQMIRISDICHKLGMKMYHSKSILYLLVEE